MARIALFVAVVAGVAYLLLDALLGAVFGLSPGQLVTVSLSVLIAVILWTAFVWLAGERLGRRDDGGGPANGA